MPDRPSPDLAVVSFQLDRLETLVTDGFARFDSRHDAQAVVIGNLRERVAVLEDRGSDEDAGGGTPLLVKVTLSAFGVIGTALGVIAAIGGHPA